MSSPDTIYITGAKGYLGTELMALLGEQAVAWDGSADLRTQHVIHCGWRKTGLENTPMARWHQITSLGTLAMILAMEPRHLVFPSTGAVATDAHQPYAQGKRLAEEMIRLAELPACIIRFPGLVGGKRRSGTWYENQQRKWLPETGRMWHKMNVKEAAELCRGVSMLRLVGTYTPDDLGYPTR